MKILFSLLAFLFICLMRPFPRGGGHGKCAWVIGTGTLIHSLGSMVLSWSPVKVCGLGIDLH